LPGIATVRLCAGKSIFSERELAAIAAQKKKKRFGAFMQPPESLSPLFRAFLCKSIIIPLPHNFQQQQEEAPAPFAPDEKKCLLTNVHSSSSRNAVPPRHTNSDDDLPQIFFNGRTDASRKQGGTRAAAAFSVGFKFLVRSRAGFQSRDCSDYF
jgi:hypothetical protein